MRCTRHTSPPHSCDPRTRRSLRSRCTSMERRGGSVVTHLTVKMQSQVQLRHPLNLRGIGGSWLHTCYRYLIVHWRFTHVCFIQGTMCGAPQSADVPRCAHFSIHFTPSWIRQQISVGKCAHRGAWEPNDVPNCHLDKTNMDNSSMHHIIIMATERRRRQKYMKYHKNMDEKKTN